MCQPAPLDQRAKLEKASEGCRETDEGESFLGVEAEPVRRADFPFSLCVKFFPGCLLPRYRSLLAGWEGMRMREAYH